MHNKLLFIFSDIFFFQYVQPSQKEVASIVKPKAGLKPKRFVQKSAHTLELQRQMFAHAAQQQKDASDVPDVLRSQQKLTDERTQASVADIQKHQKDALEYEISGDYENAIKSLVKILKIDRYN